MYPQQEAFGTPHEQYKNKWIQFFNPMIEFIQYKFKLHYSDVMFLFKHDYSDLAIQISNVVAKFSAYIEPLDMPDFLYLINIIMYHGIYMDAVKEDMEVVREEDTKIRLK